MFKPCNCGRHPTDGVKHAYDHVHGDAVAVRVLARSAYSMAVTGCAQPEQGLGGSCSSTGSQRARGPGAGEHQSG